ncbi:MAG: hypothetical protein H0U59_00940 [Gemmatimonadaceae bacterium]|nr:hypothetical protein [Gemmatimonadaceae bacterium]
MTILAAALIAPAAQAHSTPQTGDLERFLQQRQAHHQYVCANGRRKPKRWHCKALRWTHREQREHQQAKRLRYLTLPETNDWVTAVRVVQRVYPGTESWLLSCSAAEGGHGDWVRYGGGSYYPGYEWTDQVGGQLQFRFSTFGGAYRRSVDYAHNHGFRLRRDSLLSAWLSPMGQALAGGYLRKVDGSSGWHWAASVNNGCG